MSIECLDLLNFSRFLDSEMHLVLLRVKLKNPLGVNATENCTCCYLYCLISGRSIGPLRLSSTSPCPESDVLALPDGLWLQRHGRPPSLSGTSSSSLASRVPGQSRLGMSLSGLRKVWPIHRHILHFTPSTGYTHTPVLYSRRKKQKTERYELSA